MFTSEAGKKINPLQVLNKNQPPSLIPKKCTTNQIPSTSPPVYIEWPLSKCSSLGRGYSPRFVFFHEKSDHFFFLKLGPKLCFLIHIDMFLQKLLFQSNIFFHSDFKHLWPLPRYAIKILIYHLIHNWWPLFNPIAPCQRDKPGVKGPCMVPESGTWPFFTYRKRSFITKGSTIRYVNTSLCVKPGRYNPPVST